MPLDATNAPEGALKSQDRPAGAIHCIMLALLVAVCAAVRFLYLARKPFWFDECFSVEVSRIGWGNFLHLLWWREANMSLYYVLLRLWLHFGQSPFFIRSLSVVVAAATVPAVYWLARLLYDRRTSVIAAALFAFNAYSVRYAQEARSYSLFVLLTTLSSAFLVAWIREPSRKSRIGYIAISILAAYAHFYALLLIAVHWLAVRGKRGHDKTDSMRELQSAWYIIGIGVLPLLIFVAKTGAGPIKWIQRPGLRDLLEFYEHLAGGNTWILPVVLAACCVTALTPVARRLLARGQDWETWRCQFLLLWLFFPVVLTALLSFARPVFLGRYMIFCLPALLTLAAAGLARLRQSWLLGIALVVVLLLSGQGTLFVYAHDFDSERDASGEAVNFILDHAQPGDSIIFHIAATRVPYEFFRSLRTGENTASPMFAAQLGPEILFPHHGPGLDYRDFTGKPTADTIRDGASTHTRVWVMLMNNGPAEKPDPTTVLLKQLLPESLPIMQCRQSAKVDTCLYSK